MELTSESYEDQQPEWDHARVLREQLTSAFDLERFERESTVQGQFVRDVQAAAELTEVQRYRVLLIGLRALAGQSDLEVS